MARYTHGAKDTGKSGVKIQLKDIMPQMEWMHLFLHRHALATKRSQVLNSIFIHFYIHLPISIEILRGLTM